MIVGYLSCGFALMYYASPLSTMGQVIPKNISDEILLQICIQFTLIRSLSGPFVHFPILSPTHFFLL